MINLKTILASDRALAEFAARAADYFNAHPEEHTFTDGDVKPGDPFAIRWASPAGKAVVSVLAFNMPHDALLVGDLDTVKLGEPSHLVAPAEDARSRQEILEEWSKNAADVCARCQHTRDAHSTLRPHECTQRTGHWIHAPLCACEAFLVIARQP